MIRALLFLLIPAVVFANDYYTPTGNPVENSRATSRLIRAEFELIEDGLDTIETEVDAKLPNTATLDDISDGSTYVRSENNYTDAEKSKLSGIEAGATAGDSNAIHDNVGSEISALSEKATPIGADLLIIEDSADSNAKKKIQLSNLPAGSGTDAAAVHTDTASEISALSEKATPVSADLIIIEDSEAANVKKKVQVGNLPGGSGAVDSVNGATGVVVLDQDDIGDGSTHVQTTNDFTDALKTKLEGIESGADVTDATNVDAAGAVMNTDFNATTFMYATTDNTPQAKTPAEVNAILKSHQLYESDGGAVAVSTDGSGTATFAEDIKLDNTTYSDQSGIIYRGGNPYFHDFNYGDNGTVTTLGYNIFLGEDCGNFTMGSTATSTSHASFNIGIGRLVLKNVTTGYSNIGLGSTSLYSVTSGYQNMGIGVNTGALITTGTSNAAIGVSALYNASTSSDNMAIGYESLYNITTGNGSNVGIGTRAGKLISDGSTANQTSGYSLYLGTDTKAGASGNQNEIVVGYNAIGQGSNTIMLGNSSITALYCYDTSISSPSDARVKENIVSLNPSEMLAFVNDLRPVTYNKKNPADWDDDIKPAEFKDKIITDKKATIGKNGALTLESEAISVSAKSRPADNPTLYCGLIAQEVESTMEKHGIQYDLVDTTPNGMKALKYTNNIPALIGAIQALTSRIEALESAKEAVISK